jgi:CRP/FNR family transcriptional regulator
MATEDSRLLGIQRDRLLELIREDPELALSMIGGLVQRLREFVVTIEDLALRDVAARLARYLLENSRDGVCVLPGTKTQLAARLGTVLEPLSRAFRKLRQEDLIQDRGGTVRILDEDGLRDLVEGI